MRSEFIVCLLIFIITNGVFGDGTDEMKTEEVKKVEGESVTLHSGVEEYHQITWMLGPQDRNIAHCRGNTDGTRSCAIVDERLRDRLKINQTGSLTIINISTEVTGLYKLQIIDRASKQSSHKEFNVTVSARLPILTIVSEQSSCPKCLMQCSVVNETLSWYKENSSFSSISVSDLSSGVSVLLKVNDQDFYSCVMNDSIRNKTKQQNITELCQQCPEADLHPDNEAVINVPVIAAAVGAASVAAAVVIYCCYKKRRQAGQNGVDGRDGVKRETVPMIKIRSDEESPAGIEELQPNSDTCVNIH